MTNERAKLNFDDGDLPSAPPPTIPAETITEVTRRAGFHETPKAAGPAAPAVSEAPKPDEPSRRARRRTGRIHQFATRLRRETIDAYLDYADRHEITIAETLERAQKALLAKEKASR